MEFTIQSLFLASAGMIGWFAKKRFFGFHSRDYQFYLEAYRGRWNSLWGETSEITLHPNGTNVWGFSGIDGFPTIAWDIHFSPITYLLSGLYPIIGELGIQILFSLAIAVAAASWVHEILPRVVSPFAIRWLVVIALAFPVAIAASYDLRIWILFSASILLAFMLAVNSKTAAPVILVSTVALLSREEGYYFVVVLSAILFLKGKRLAPYVLFLAALLQATAAFVIFSHSSFEWEFGPRSVGFFVLPLLFFALAAIKTRFLRDLQLSKSKFLVLTSSIYFLPLLLVWMRSLNPANLFLSIWDARFFILFLLAITLVAGLRHVAMKSGAVALLGLLYALGSVAIVWMPLFSDGNRLRAAELTETQKLFSQQEFGLVSMLSHQAFQTHNVEVLERLPAQASRDDERMWPENIERLLPRINLATFIVTEKTSEVLPVIEKHFPGKCQYSLSLVVCQRETLN